MGDRVTCAEQDTCRVGACRTEVIVPVEMATDEVVLESENEPE